MSSRRTPPPPGKATVAFTAGSRPAHGPLGSSPDFLEAEAEAIFFDLLGVPPEQRQAEAQTRCERRPELLTRVLRLLELDSQPGALPAPPPMDVLMAAIRRDAGQTATTDPGRLGPYRLEQKVGAGGMGVVYRARHVPFDRVVALKTLPDELLRDHHRRERFLREIRLIGRLDHPGIVRALHADEYDGSLCLIMEFVEGTDLGKRVREHGPFAPGEACTLIRQAAVILQHVHQQGIVHRDIKPSNLMLTPDGRIKLLDLGIARSLEWGGDDGEHITTSNLLLGSIPYMAPEQILAPHSVDIRADLYSLGASLHFLLTGEPPTRAWSGTSIDAPPAPHRGQAGTLATTPRIPASLRPILARLLADDPGRRFPDPAQVVEAIDAWSAGNVRTAERGDGASSRRRSRGLAIVASITFTLLLVGSLGLAAATWHGLSVPAGVATMLSQEPLARIDQLRILLQFLSAAIGVLAALLGLLYQLRRAAATLAFLAVAILVVVAAWHYPDQRKVPPKTSVDTTLPAGPQSGPAGLEPPASTLATPTSSPTPDARWTPVLRAMCDYIDASAPVAPRARRIRFLLVPSFPELERERVEQILQASCPVRGVAPTLVDLRVKLGDWGVMALDLEAQDWTESEWNAMTRGYPYGLDLPAQRQGTLRELREYLERRTDVELPLLRADWLLMQPWPPERAALRDGVKRLRAAYGQPLSLGQAATELGVEPQQLREAIHRLGGSARGLEPLGGGGTVTRADWENGLFRQAARAALGASTLHVN